MLSLRTTTAQRSGCLCVTTPALCSAHLAVASSPALQYRKSWMQNRGIHAISLPLHSEDTTYTRSSHAFSRAQAQAQMEIAELRRAVEALRNEFQESRKAVGEQDAMIKEKDTRIRDLQLDLKQKRGVIRQLEMIAQRGISRDEIVVEKIEGVDGMMKGWDRVASMKIEDRIRGADTMMRERVLMADTMMELMKEMRESKREAYDPL